MNRIIMFIFFALGLIGLVIGVNSLLNAIYTNEFFGFVFGVTVTVISGIIIIVDLIILILYLKKKNVSITNVNEKQ